MMQKGWSVEATSLAGVAGALSDRWGSSSAAPVLEFLVQATSNWFEVPPLACHVHSVPAPHVCHELFAYAYLLVAHPPTMHPLVPLGLTLIIHHPWHDILMPTSIYDVPPTLTKVICYGINNLRALYPQ